MSSPAQDGRSDARNGEVLMATTITMPQLGETVTEGTVAQWLKKVGDTRRKVRSRSSKSRPIKSTPKCRRRSPASSARCSSKKARPLRPARAIAVIDEVGAATERNPRRHAGNAARNRWRQRASRRRTLRPRKHGNGHAADAVKALRARRTAKRYARRRAARRSPAVRRLAREHSVDIRAHRGQRRQRTRDRRRRLDGRAADRRASDSPSPSARTSRRRAAARRASAAAARERRRTASRFRARRSR